MASARFEDIATDFELLDEWEDRYRYVIDLGRAMPPLDPALRVPRLSTPRVRVPAGAVAVADTWSAVYPRESPGGWRLLGRTDLVLWDSARPEPALLVAGTRVRFEAAP